MASTGNVLELALLALQAFQVVFLWIHDWVPLGCLNDVVAVRSQETLLRLAIVTLVQSVPYTVGLFFSARYFDRLYPGWLDIWLWISYGILFVGQLRAWWIPYFLWVEPERAERFQRMFGNTHSFLPEHNGIVPNTAHILLHLATAATLLILFISSVVIG
ncbi:MAG: hypothetical protein WA183_03970 [Chthoniobacterales bacterium]